MNEIDIEYLCETRMRQSDKGGIPLLPTTNLWKGRRGRMTEDLEDIRAKKIAEISDRMKAVEQEVGEIQAMQQEFTWADFGYDEPEWGFRESQEVPDAFEICQKGQTVALTQAPNWAMLVTDLLNRARLEELIVSYKEGEEQA